jgi:hypothetical protein
LAIADPDIGAKPDGSILMLIQFEILKLCATGPFILSSLWENPRIAGTVAQLVKAAPARKIVTAGREIARFIINVTELSCWVVSKDWTTVPFRWQDGLLHSISKTHQPRLLPFSPFHAFHDADNRRVLFMLRQR